MFKGRKSLADSVYCELIDVSGIAHIPQPEFGITTLPNSIVVHPGDEKVFELQLKSNTNLQSNVTLDSNVSLATNAKLAIAFEPNELHIPPFGISSSLIRVKALDNATNGTYALPILANITFPTFATSDSGLTSKLLSHLQIQELRSYSNIQLVVTPSPPLTNQLSIPTEFYVGIYGILASAIAGWSVPAIAASLNTKRQRGHLDKYISIINENLSITETK